MESRLYCIDICDEDCTKIYRQNNVKPSLVLHL